MLVGDLVQAERFKRRAVLNGHILVRLAYKLMQIAEEILFSPANIYCLWADTALLPIPESGAAHSKGKRSILTEHVIWESLAHLSGC